MKQVYLPSIGFDGEKWLFAVWMGNVIANRFDAVDLEIVNCIEYGWYQDEFIFTYKVRLKMEQFIPFYQCRFKKEIYATKKQAGQALVTELKAMKYFNKKFLERINKIIKR